MNVEVKIKIFDKEVSLDEARQIYQVLGKLFGEKIAPLIPQSPYDFKPLVPQEAWEQPKKTWENPRLPWEAPYTFCAI